MLYWLLSLVLLAAAFILQPAAAQCPPGHGLRTGIRRSGLFECWPTPVGSMDWDGTYGRPERSVQPDGVLESRIFCTGGSVPIVVDARTVGCQARH
jgi:hypothetical protein